MKHFKYFVWAMLVSLFSCLSVSAENYILYTSSDGKVVEPEHKDVFGANIVSNTYNNGQGKILFDGEVTKIGEEAFVACSLTSIEIPNSVYLIRGNAFSYCTNLTSVKIGDLVTEIGNDAFRECENLSEITSLNNKPPHCGPSPFYKGPNKSTCILKVPASAVEAYRNAEVWKDFKNIEAINLPQGDASNPLGDLNGDGEVDVNDVVTLVGIILDK